MGNDFTFSIESKINSTRTEVWPHITNMANVNVELAPYVKMTYPKDKSALNDAAVPISETSFTSVILLFGFIPVDFHQLKFDKIEPGHAFYENSTTLMHKYWKHTRSINEKDEGIWVKDEVHFLPRLPLVGYLMLPLYRHIFANRHRKLQTTFGRK